jgi:quercetin dioxygenase-like cupin family protein
MKPIIAAAASLALLGAVPALAERMVITPKEARPSTKGPAANFTGTATVNPFFGANEHTRATGGLVTFEPGARSAWHTHPGGQMLIVVSGRGYVQEEGGPKREIKEGDVIWTPPGVKHWHGATATSAMSHIAITNVVNGKNVDWMQKVSDEEYRR